MKIKIIIASIITCLSLPTSAEDNPDKVSDANSELRLKSEAVQWLPHSVTVLDKSDLQETYRRDLEDLESLVPGMIVDRMNTTPRGAAIAIRGLGSSGASKAFDPAVAVNIDGVYINTDYLDPKIVPNTFFIGFDTKV